MYTIQVVPKHPGKSVVINKRTKKLCFIITTHFDLIEFRKIVVHFVNCPKKASLGGSESILKNYSCIIWDVTPYFKVLWTRSFCCWKYLNFHSCVQKDPKCWNLLIFTFICLYITGDSNLDQILLMTLHWNKYGYFLPIFQIRKHWTKPKGLK